MTHEYWKFEVDKTKAPAFVYQASQLDGVLSVEYLEQEEE